MDRGCRTLTRAILHIGSALAFVLCAPSLAAQLPALVPDAAQAQVDGRIAVGYWPMRGGGIVGPEGYRVHLAPSSELENELAFPAGVWFQPPADSYRTWVEGTDEDGSLWVSPKQNRLRFRGGPFRGRGFAGEVEVGPAGRVVVDPEVGLTPSRSVRLLHVTVPRQDRPLGRGFLRAITAEEADRPVLMPAGEVVALLHDRESGEYLAAAPPVLVGGATVASVKPGSRRGVAQALVILERPQPLAAADDLKLFLESGDETRAPDVLVPTWQWVYALWYDVPGRSATLAGGSEGVYLEPVEVVLQPGSMTTFRGHLRPRPHLDARLELPPELTPSGARLEIDSKQDGRRLAEREMSLVPETVTRIDGLPPERLSLILRLDGNPVWKLSETIDLSDGEPREHVFRPDPFVLSGTVYHRDEPTPAIVRLATLNEPDMDATRIWVEAEADEEGDYEMVLFTAGCYAPKVVLPEHPDKPFSGLLPECMDGDTTLDIHVPGSAARVLVRDAFRGDPVPEALVTLQVHMDTERRRGSSTRAGWTDEEGAVELPLLYPGRLQAWAEKDGYLPLADPLESELRDGATTDLTLTLEPILDARTLRLFLPDGRPASGAEVRAQRTAWNEPPVWEGTAGADGRVKVPKQALGAWLLVRHPQAGSWMDGWAPTGEEEIAWNLPASSGPVTFRTVGLDGEPVRSTLAVRLPRSWVAGRALAWLTGTQIAGSNSRGLWTASRLPATGLAIVAGPPHTLTLALQGFLDGSAHPLTPPWPTEPVEVVADAR